MPERKGRRRRPEATRREMGATSVSGRDAPRPQRTSPPRRDPLLPSNTARATGLMIALVTAFIGIVMIRDVIGGASDGAEAVARIAVAVFLIVLGIVVAALSVFPAQIRRRVRGE